MVANLTEINIRGGIFVNPINIPLLENVSKGKPINICLVYGKNGSGKSSIARALGNTIIQADERNYDVNLIGTNIQAIKQHIYVFDEVFVHKRVKFFQNKKLDALVLLGDQADIDDKIQIRKKHLEFMEKKIIPKRIKSSDNYQNQLEEKKNAIEDILKRRGSSFLSCGWAEREREIREIRQSASVRLSHWLIKKDYTKSREELEQSLLDMFEQYQQAKGGTKITGTIPIVQDIDFVLIEELLNLQVESPELSDREKLMFEFLKNSSFINKIKTFLADEKTENCPFCYQEVEKVYKQKLLSEIHKIFRTSVSDQHVRVLNALRSKNLQYIECIDEDFKRLSPVLYGEIEVLIRRYQSVTKDILEKIEEKSRNPFQPINNQFGRIGLDELVKELQEKLIQLSDLQKKFNNTVDDSSNLKDGLIKLNTELAFYEIKEELDGYWEVDSELKIRGEKQLKSINFQKTIQRQISILESSKRNTNIAIDIINKYLAYIFFSDTRLQIEASQDGDYAILVRGERVHLNWLSEGERNAIALTYFFSTILEGKSEAEYFKDANLIVLDDPISSFDYSNKIGVFSFFRKMLLDIFLGNTDSKVIILTHQLETMFHFDKVHSDIDKSLKHIQGSFGKYKVIKKQLHSGSLEDFHSRSHNDYGDNLQSIYAFASNKDDSHGDVIGNMIRKALEAYATFNYKVGTEELFYHRDILNLIPNAAAQDVYKNLMARLLLNNGSHYEETAKTFPEVDFYSFLDSEEKVKTARLVICFLYMLNKLHVKQHLSCKDADITVINGWISDFFPCNTEENLNINR